MKKFNIVVPLAGRGQRMIDGGYHLPKPMLICGDKSIIEWSMSSIDISECYLYFIVRKEHIDNFAIDSYLHSKWPNSTVIVCENDTSGAVETVLTSCSNITCNALPFIIYTPDTVFFPGYKPREEEFTDNHGLILTFKANSPNYSYSLIKNGLVTDIAEKRVISDAASVGVYGFKNWGLFSKYAHMYVRNSKANKTECHIAPLYKYLICNGGSIGHLPIQDIHIMGTPDEFKFCEEVSLKYFRNRKFALCSDHSGYRLKKAIGEWLSKQGIEYIDFGCFSTKDCDYNPYVESVCDFVRKERDYFGIGCCRSGQGVNICANKQKAIRSCLITDDCSASLAIKHNAANFFALSQNAFYNECISDIDYEAVNSAMLEILNEKFEGGRHQNRMMKHAYC